MTNLENVLSHRATNERWNSWALELVEVWMHRSRTRAALRKLDAHLLNDAGITPAEAYREGAKPLWRE